MSTAAWFRTDDVNSGRTPGDLAVPELAQAVLDIRRQGRVGRKPHVPAQVLADDQEPSFGKLFHRRLRMIAKAISVTTYRVGRCSLGNRHAGLLLAWIAEGCDGDGSQNSHAEGKGDAPLIAAGRIEDEAC